ncbi:MAG: photosynthetic reaction center subunit H [Gammaproteobacteria bacterium]
MSASIDLVEVLFSLFWLFFIGLILYLHRESKREGYPLDSDRTDRSGGRVQVQGFPSVPDTKHFLTAHGETVAVPRAELSDAADDSLAVKPAARYPGAPMVPTGNPMHDGVGPAAYSNRANVPDKTLHNENRIVPMRVATDFVVMDKDPDPRGMEVLGADNKVAGTVADVWVDRAEPLVTFFEVDLGSANGGKHVLLPIGFSKIDGNKRQIKVRSIYASQFADVPAIASPDEITLREEDRIMGYFGGGTLYADAARQEPLI